MSTVSGTTARHWPVARHQLAEMQRLATLIKAIGVD
jgi:hypothetical protein